MDVPERLAAALERPGERVWATCGEVVAGLLAWAGRVARAAR